MSLPTHAFLDTSVFDGQQYNFSSSTFTTFIPVAVRLGITLLLPDPTEREVKRHIRERSEEALRALKLARRSTPFLRKWKHFPQWPRDSAESWELHRIAIDEWTSFLGQLPIIRCGYDGVQISTIMNWYDTAQAPFASGRKRKEFPDALAVAILDAYARRHEVHIAVVSSDHDFRLACERFSSLLHFSSLPHLTELLTSEPEKIRHIKTMIQAALPVIEDIARASQLSFYYYDDNYEIEHSEIRNISITNINVVAIGDGVCTATFDAIVDSLHTVHIHEWCSPEYYAQEDEVDEIVNCALIPGVAKILLDKKSHSVLGVPFFELDESEIRVSGNDP